MLYSFMKVDILCTLLPFTDIFHFPLDLFLFNVLLMSSVKPMRTPLCFLYSRNIIINTLLCGFGKEMHLFQSI